MPRFSIKSALIALTVISMGIIAIMNPTEMWQNIVTLAVAIFAIMMIPLAIGAQGKWRLQVLSFAILCLGWTIYLETFSESSFAKMQRSFIGSWDDWLGSTSKPLPDGRFLKQNYEGYFLTSPPHHRGRQPITIEEIEKQGLTPYIVDQFTGVGFEHFFQIAKSLMAFLVGSCGYFLTGWAYDRRQSPGIAT